MAGQTKAPDKKAFGAYFGAPETSGFLGTETLSRSRFLGY
jgi:hypothetical protein